MKKILVIEDEPDVKKGIKSLLEIYNYKVFTASDGLDAVAVAREIRPDLILCDIMMPEVDGYSVLNQLSKQEETKHIPFIFLTAKASREDVRSGMEQGADDYIIKPFKSEELLRAIEVRLAKYDKLKNLRSTGGEGKRKLEITDKQLLNKKGKPELVEIQNIRCIMAAGNYSEIYVSNKKILMRRTVSEWDNMLPENHFVRVHRGIIINLNFVLSISNWTKSTYKIAIKDIKEPVVTSQMYSKNIRKLLS